MIRVNRLAAAALTAVFLLLALLVAGTRVFPTASAAERTTGEKAADGQPAESAPGTGRTPNAVAGDTPMVPEKWEIAATLAGHKDVVTSLAFSPDGKQLFSGSFDGEIKVWDTRSHKEVASIIAHKDAKMCRVLAVAPSGDVLASGGGPVPGEVKVWDARTLQLRATLMYPRPVYCLAFSPKSDLIAAAGENEVRIWSVGDSQQKYKLSVGMWPITGLAFSPNGRILYVGGFPAIGKVAASSGVLRAWDVSRAAQRGEIEFSHPVEGIALSVDGNTLAIAACALHVLDVSLENDRVLFKERFSALDQQWRGNAPIFQEQFRGVALDPSQTVVAGAAGSPGPLAPEAGHVALFALHNGQRIAQLETPRPPNADFKVGDYNISAVAFSPDGKLLASGGKERIVTLWTPAAAPAGSASESLPTGKSSPDGDNQAATALPAIPETVNLPVYSALGEFIFEGRKELGLSTEQKKKLYAISGSFQPKLQEIFNEAENLPLKERRIRIQEKLEQHKNDLCKKVEEVLTPQQVEAYKKDCLALDRLRDALRPCLHHALPSRGV